MTSPASIPSRFPAAAAAIIDSQSWEEKAFAEDSSGVLGGCVWPPRSYSCSFCRREFRSAQALGGHMNVHRRDRARMRQSSAVKEDDDEEEEGNMVRNSSLLLNPNCFTNPNYGELRLQLKRGCLADEDEGTKEGMGKTKRRNNSMICATTPFSVMPSLLLRRELQQEPAMIGLMIGPQNIVEDLDLELRL